jgi:mannose-6-phosphate isomerase
VLYPLRFNEILRDYGFGDRWIVRAFEKPGLPDDHRIAETWEVCDRPGESSSVNNGPLAGQTLHQLIAQCGEALLGRDLVSRFGMRFPLLIKLLDASHVLAEQAHHSDALAARRGLNDPGKTEAWYMLRVREGATIRCGQVDDRVNKRALRAALLDGSIRELMRTYAVNPQDAFLLYAGTMHYSAGGVLFYEIMQNSDVYIGLQKPYDDLPPEEREAKVQSCLEGIHLEPGYECKIPPVTLHEGANRHTFVLACQHFALERLDLTAPYTLYCDGERFLVLTQIEGTSTVVSGVHGEVLRPGQSCLLPAALGPVILEPSAGCALLKAYVPNLMQNIIGPLRQEGGADSAIAGLGGKTSLNPLVELVSRPRTSHGDPVELSS